MKKALRILTAIAGTIFLFSGLQWLVDPSAAGANIGLPLLNGVARSSQIGDIGAFFFANGVMMLLAAYTLKRTWFYAPALLFASAATFRTASWLFQGAAFTPEFIAAEVLLTVLLLSAASKSANKS